MRKTLFMAGGIAVGIVLSQAFGSSAQTPAGNYSLCYASTLWGLTASNVNGGEKPKDYLRVPKGWTVVGGAQYHTDPAVILCK